MKFYRVIKDHPYWEVGAIISNDGEEGSDQKKNNYSAISELWNKEQHEMESPEEYREVVEKSPDYFERVYKVSVLKQVKYLPKDKARKLHDNLYKGDK